MFGATIPRAPWGAIAVAIGVSLSAGCGDAGEGAGPRPQVLTLRVVTEPGLIFFDEERLTARAGPITFELINEKRKGHNIRIQTGRRCCFRPGSRDLGGTRTIGTGRTRAVVTLEPGVYTYLCSAGGHWHTQHGTLVVR